MCLFKMGKIIGIHISMCIYALILRESPEDKLITSEPSQEPPKVWFYIRHSLEIFVTWYGIDHQIDYHGTSLP